MLFGEVGTIDNVSQMNLFSKLMASNKGRLAWLLLMFLVLFILPHPMYDLLTWFMEALLAWFAVSYLSDKLNLKYKKIWKIFSIAIPFFSFLAFLIIKNRYLNSLSNRRKITGSRKIVFIKLFSLIGSFIFIVISLYFLVTVDNYYKFVNNYLNLANKDASVGNEINKTFNDLSKNPQKSLYISSLDLLNKANSIFNEESLIINNIKNNLLVLLFPEVKKRIDSAEQFNKYLLTLNEVSLVWNKSAIESGYASDKTQNLLKNVDKISNLKKNYTDLELTRHPTLASMIFGNLFTASIYLIVLVYGLILVVFSSFMSFIRFKQKQKFVSFKWFGLFVINILSLGLFILTLFYF